MGYGGLEVEPASSTIGAIVHGVDLATLNDETFTDIKRVWLDYCVIFLRNQNITPDQQIAFARRFGDIHHHPYMRGLDDYPDILEVVKEPGDSYTFGAVWHTDQMFNPRPAMATMLYSKEIPSRGGDTMFSNQYHAFETLSEPMRDMLTGIRTHNVGNGFRRGMGGQSNRSDRYARNPAMQAKLRDPGNVPTEALHPLIRTHPETGRKLLYIGSHTQTLDGFAESEADVLIEFLRNHSARPEFTCRFRWEVGSLALWDNRCVQHRALADYDERRRMHRITIAGDTPY